MNGELKKRAVAIIDGEYAHPSEKMDLILGIALDTHEVVSGHEARISALEVLPATVGRVLKFVLGLGALAAAIAALTSI